MKNITWNKDTSYELRVTSNFKSSKNHPILRNDKPRPSGRPGGQKTQNQKPKPLEVHHHTHTPNSHRERKKWTHYVWEFLMLFLAVFCGFLAENQREHIVEHKREKQYIRSLVSDLETDTTNISQANKWFERINVACDSLLSNYEDFITRSTPQTHKNFQFILSGYPDFVYTDRTIQQLKNAGGLRLIRNMEASDSIVAYDANIRDLLIEESSVTFFYDRIHDMSNRVYNFRRYDQFKKTRDSAVLTNLWISDNIQDKEQLYNTLRVYNSTIDSYIRYRNRLLKKAGRLIELLRQKYHLD